MRCIVCKKDCEETELYEGILEDGMVMVCSTCAEEEGVPIIKKPSEIQLEKADERFSVRERMERMSGMRDATEISSDQTVVQGNLAKLRMPEKKELHEDILDNYYWTLNISRRRKKLSVSQLASQVGTTPEIIRNIEKGKLPEEFSEIFLKIEALLGIKLLKKHDTKISFLRNKDEEKELLSQVRKKMGEISIDNKSSQKTEKDIEKRREKLDQIERGEIDMSVRENLEDVTLNDLIERKRQKERRETKSRAKSRVDSMVGEDIDLELEEV
jgi:ribosome-binding protein aMBF1 (putative translation factor)